MFSVALTPWHGLGVVLENAPSPSEAIALAGAGFTMRKVALVTADGVEVPGYYAIVREDSEVALGVVGEGYTIVQPAAAFEFFNPIAEVGKLTMETGGVLQNGKIIWALGKLAEAEVTKGDPIQAHLLFAKGTVGNMANTIKLCETRVVCGNTLSAGLGEDTTTVKVRHTRHAKDRLDEIAASIAKAKDSFENTLETYRHLASKQVDPERYFEALYPSKEGAKIDKAKGRRDELMEAYESAPGSTHSRGSAWAAYNALTHHVTHAYPSNLPAKADSLRDREARAKALYFGARERKLEEALQIAIIMADGSEEYMSAHQAVELGVSEAELGRSLLEDMLAAAAA